MAGEVTYTSHDAADLVEVGLAKKVGNASALSVAASAQGDLSIATNKLYIPRGGVADRGTRRGKMVAVVNFDPGDASSYTLDEALLTVWYLVKGIEDLAPETNIIAKYIWGAERFDLTRGLMGETNQQMQVPSNLTSAVSAEPSGIYPASSTTVRSFIVTEMADLNMPRAFRLSLKVTNDSQSTLNMYSLLAVAAL